MEENSARRSVSDLASASWLRGAVERRNRDLTEETQGEDILLWPASLAAHLIQTYETDQLFCKAMART